MPDYKNMYLTMYNAVTDAIEILKAAQLKAEEEYIKSGEKEKKTIEFSIFLKTEK